MVVLRRDQDECVEGRGQPRPRPGGGLLVLAERGRLRLGKQRQADVGEINQVQVEGGNRAGAHPFRDRLGLTDRTGAARDHADPQPCCHVLVAMIRASQRVGLSIQEIREALSALPPRQAPAPEDWERLAAHLRHVASQRIGELFTILDELGPAPATEPRARPTAAAHHWH
jgi:hypothetical protein